MALQAEVIDEINANTDKTAREAWAAHPESGGFTFAFRLTMVPMGVFLRTYLLRGGLLGGRGAFKDSVNAWAGAFIKEAKCYELVCADKEKAIIESRDFD